jgi:hypothetical protein
MKLLAVAILGGLFVTVTAAYPHAFGQQSKDEIVVRVTEAAPATTAPIASGLSYLNGYHLSIHGETIEYHSPDPDADSALLVRAQNIAHSISWETDPMPKASGDFSQFIWLAGIECAGFVQ